MQASKNILLIRPSCFAFNAETAASNAFQVIINSSEEEIKQQKLQEFDAFVNTLTTKGVRVNVIEDTVLPGKPDAIFPNNWVSFHADGTVILYPMQAKNRRPERREDILEILRKDYQIHKVVDLSHYEEQNKFLEGTGSIIFDHVNKLAFACLSPRTDKELLIEVCTYLDYKPIYFYAHDKKGKEIYHTNVMMCIAEKFAVICLESINDSKEKSDVVEALTETGHEIVDISFEQMICFAGNMLGLKTKDDKSILALSQTSFNSLTVKQRTAIEKYTELVPLFINTIETMGGGSARCMIAEIFLPQIEGNVPQY